MREIYWVYQCPDQECGQTGLVHDYEDTAAEPTPIEPEWVWCPRCGEIMTQLRVAEGEDLENPVQLVRYNQYGSTFRMPLREFFRAPRFEIQSDSHRSGLVQKRANISRNTGGYELLDAEKTAESLGMSVQTIRRLWRDKRLGYVQVNNKQRKCTLEHIQEFIERQSLQIGPRGTTPSPRSPEPGKEMVEKEASVKDIRKRLGAW